MQTRCVFRLFSVRLNAKRLPWRVQELQYRMTWGITHRDSTSQARRIVSYNGIVLHGFSWTSTVRYTELTLAAPCHSTGKPPRSTSCTTHPRPNLNPSPLPTFLQPPSPLYCSYTLYAHRRFRCIASQRNNPRSVSPPGSARPSSVLSVAGARHLLLYGPKKQKKITAAI